MDMKMSFEDPNRSDKDKKEKQKREQGRRILWQITDRYLSEMSYYFIHPHP